VGLVGLNQFVYAPETADRGVSAAQFGRFRTFDASDPQELTEGRPRGAWRRAVRPTCRLRPGHRGRDAPLVVTTMPVRKPPWWHHQRCWSMTCFVGRHAIRQARGDADRQA
jgi:hypothetical protein